MSRARGECLAHRVDGGAATVDRRERTRRNAKGVALAIAVERMVVHARREAPGLYRIDPAAWLRVCVACDEFMDSLKEGERC